MFTWSNSIFSINNTMNKLIIVGILKNKEKLSDAVRSNDSDDSLKTILLGINPSFALDPFYLALPWWVSLLRLVFWKNNGERFDEEIEGFLSDSSENNGVDELWLSICDWMNWDWDDSKWINFWWWDSDSWWWVENDWWGWDSDSWGGWWWGGWWSDD